MYCKGFTPRHWIHQRIPFWMSNKWSFIHLHHFLKIPTWIYLYELGTDVFPVEVNSHLNIAKLQNRVSHLYFHTKKNILFFFLIQIVQAAEIVSYINSEHWTQCYYLASDLFVQYAMVFSNIISLGSGRGWQSRNTGGYTRQVEIVGTSALSSISALPQLEWGLPHLLLPLHFVHEAGHLDRNFALNTRITAGKKETEVYTQHSRAIFC